MAEMCRSNTPRLDRTFPWRGPSRWQSKRDFSDWRRRADDFAELLDPVRGEQRLSRSSESTRRRSGKQALRLSTAERWRVTRCQGSFPPAPSPVALPDVDDSLKHFMWPGAATSQCECAKHRTLKLSFVSLRKEAPNRQLS